MRYNNQPIVGVHSFYDDREEPWLGQSVWGIAMASFWPSNERQKTNHQKYGMILDGHRLMIIYTTTNQEQALMMEKRKERSAETLADLYKGKILLVRVNAFQEPCHPPSHPAGYSKYQEGQPIFEAHRNLHEILTSSHYYRIVSLILNLV
jgi:hypothetical protein